MKQLTAITLLLGPAVLALPGATTVNCRATNSCREFAVCSFIVTVARDITAPVMQCPANVVASICNTCAVAQCAANVLTPIRPARVSSRSASPPTRPASQYPLFRQLVSEKKLDFACGVDAEGKEKCSNMQKFGDSGYPELQGWKSGNGGKGPQLGVPWCTEAVVRQATRLDRSMVVALSQTANKDKDGDNPFDFGYHQLFTPDYRGGGGINSPAITDFAVRKIHDTLAVSAVIQSADQLRLDAWQIAAGIGQVSPLNASSLTINNLAAGTQAPRAKILDVAKLPTVGESDADYLTGHLEGGGLRLNVWRVGAKPGQ